MEKSKEQVINEMEKINDEIDELVEKGTWVMSKRYQELTRKLVELLKELDEAKDDEE